MSRSLYEHIAFFASGLVFIWTMALGIHLFSDYELPTAGAIGIFLTIPLLAAAISMGVYSLLVEVYSLLVWAFDKWRYR